MLSVKAAEQFVIDGHSVADHVYFKGSRFANYRPGEITLFHANYSGFHTKVKGEIADTLGSMYDQHNFRVHMGRIRRFNEHDPAVSNLDRQDIREALAEYRLVMDEHGVVGLVGSDTSKEH